MKYTHTRLLVEDLPGMYRFYHEQLGLECIMGSENDVYAEFSTGGSIIALFPRSFMHEALQDQRLYQADIQRSAYVLTFEVEDVASTYERLKRAGVECVARPQPRTDWMIFTAHFRDPEGNLIEIYSPL